MKQRSPAFVAVYLLGFALGGWVIWQSVDTFIGGGPTAPPPAPIPAPLNAADSRVRRPVADAPSPHWPTPTERGAPAPEPPRGVARQLDEVKRLFEAGRSRDAVELRRAIHPTTEAEVRLVVERYVDLLIAGNSAHARDLAHVIYELRRARERGETDGSLYAIALRSLAESIPRIETAPQPPADPGRIGAVLPPLVFGAEPADVDPFVQLAVRDPQGARAQTQRLVVWWIGNSDAQQHLPRVWQVAIADTGRQSTVDAVTSIAQLGDESVVDWVLQRARSGAGSEGEIRALGVLPNTESAFAAARVALDEGLVPRSVLARVVEGLITRPGRETETLAWVQRQIDAAPSYAVTESLWMGIATYAVGSRAHDWPTEQLTAWLERHTFEIGDATFDQPLIATAAQLYFRMETNWARALDLLDTAGASDPRRAGLLLGSTPDLVARVPEGAARQAARDRVIALIETLVGPEQSNGTQQLAIRAAGRFQAVELLPTLRDIARDERRSERTRTRAQHQVATLAAVGAGSEDDR